MVATGETRDRISIRCMSAVGVIASAMCLSGCTSWLSKFTGQPDSLDWTKWAEIQTKLATASTVDTWTSLTAQAYAQVVPVCISVANYYERNGKYGDSSRLSIGLIGSIAAGVVAPALAAANAARSVIAIWAGIGGVSAGFLTSYDQSQFAAKANLDVYHRISHSLSSYAPPGIITSQAAAQAEMSKLMQLYSECKLPTLTESTTQEQIDAANEAAKKATAAQAAAQAAYASAVAAASDASASAKRAAAGASSAQGQ